MILSLVRYFRPPFVCQSLTQFIILPATQTHAAQDSQEGSHRDTICSSKVQHGSERTRDSFCPSDIDRQVPGRANGTPSTGLVGPFCMSRCLVPEEMWRNCEIVVAVDSDVGLYQQLHSTCTTRAPQGIAALDESILCASVAKSCILQVYPANVPTKRFKAIPA